MRYTNEEIAKRVAKIKRIKLIFKLLMYIIILPITIYNVYLLVMSYINPKETPSFFGIKSYAVISGSMQPELKVGDIIIVKQIKEDELKVGDILSFRKNDLIITHRVIRIENEKITTKGDYNNAEDSDKVSYGDIEGKVVYVIPFFGKIVFALRNKIVIIVIILLLYLIYMHSLKQQSKKQIRREKRKNLNYKS